MDKDPIIELRHIFSTTKIGNIEKANSRKRLLCIIVNNREIVDKNGDLMSFLRVRDIKGKEIDITVFASAYEHIHEYLNIGDVYLMKVKKSVYKEKEGFLLNTGYDEDEEYLKECALNIDSKTVKKWLLEENYDNL